MFCTNIKDSSGYITFKIILTFQTVYHSLLHIKDQPNTSRKTTGEIAHDFLEQEDYATNLHTSSNSNKLDLSNATCNLLKFNTRP